MDRPSEAVEYHTRLLQCSIEVEHSREYWQHVEHSATVETAQTAFTEYWFGARSMPRVDRLLTNFRERFDQFPPSLFVLHRWKAMDAVTRRLICHWHLQLADRLYREFTGVYLVERAGSGRTDVTRDLVVRWIEQLVPERWTLSTRIQFARKLLFSAVESGLLKGSRDPRQFQTPRVSDDALTYILYLLRTVRFQGTLTSNPYLRSVGLSVDDLERRLRALPACRLRRQGELSEFTWNYDGLIEWAEDAILRNDRMLRETA